MRGIASVFSLCVFVCAGLALLSTTVNASTVTWEFTGNVTITNAFGGSYWDDLGVETGDVVTGRVTFSPGTAAATAFSGADGYGGTFLHSSFNAAHASIHDVVINGFSYIPNYVNPTARLRTSLNTTNPNFAVPNSDPFDTFAIDNFEQGFQRFQVVRVVAQPPGSGIIPTTSFMSSPPALADLLFGQNYVQELDSNGVASGLLSRWTSVQRVPVPASFFMLLTGIAFWRVFRATP